MHIRYLSGLPVEGVFARAGAHFFEAHAERGIEDFATIELTLAGGAIGTITTGRIGQDSHPLNGANHLTIIGTQGTLLLDLRRQTAELCSGVAADRGTSSLTRDDASDALVNHFVRVLDGDEPAWADVEAGRAHVATLMAAYESGRYGRRGAAGVRLRQRWQSSCSSPLSGRRSLLPARLLSPPASLVARAATQPRCARSWPAGILGLPRCGRRSPPKAGRQPPRRRLGAGWQPSGHGGGSSAPAGWTCLV